VPDLNLLLDVVERVVDPGANVVALIELLSGSRHEKVAARARQMAINHH
jgi:hypothetical protein